MALLLFYLFLALSISFLCSVMEAVLLSTPISFINMKDSEGVKGAKLLKELKRDIDKPISAILSINTIAHTVGAAGVGAQAVEIFGENYFGLISAMLTLLILVFSEIFPKSIGAHYWKSLAFISARIIKGMIFITYPLVVISEFITRVITPKNESETTISREELSVMVDIGAVEGTLKSSESKIIKNLIKLRSVRAHDVMTPRVVVARANEEMSIKEFYSKKEYLHFSRIPVFAAQDENITGFVLRQEVLENMANDTFSLKLKEIKKPIVIVPDKQPLTVLWEALLTKKAHIAMVVDEYGGFEGIVTLEDIIETILGLEITDERDVVSDMQQYARDRWREKQIKYNHLINKKNVTGD